MKQNIEKKLGNTQKKEFFDQFIFLDKLTNRSIAIRQIKRCTSKNKVKCHKPRFSQQQQLKQLDDCIAILYQTNAFKKQNLKQKLFGPIHKNIQQNHKQSQDEITKKKRLIRSMLTQGINKRNKQELSEYLSGNGHKPDEELLRVAKNKAYPISKNKVKEIVGALEKKENIFDFGKHGLQTSQQDALANKLNLLQSQIQVELRQKLRKTGQFLIEPKKNLFPIKRIRNHKNIFSKNIRQSQIKSIEQLKWKQVSLQNSQATFRPRKAHWAATKNYINSKSVLIFDIIVKGQAQDVEIAVGKYGSEIIKSRDSEGNNLMHLAAKSDKTQIFEYLLKCRGIQGLLEKNNEGDNPIDIAYRLENLQILKFVPNSLI